METIKSSEQIAREINQTCDKLNRLIHEGLAHKDLMILDHKNVLENTILKRNEFSNYVNIKVCKPILSR